MNRVLAVLVGLCIAGCGGPGEDDPSSTLGGELTVPDESQVVTTTEGSTEVATTTTIGVTTTTTTIPGEAVVVAEEGVLGMWTGTIWRDDVVLADVPFGGEYQVFDFLGSSSIAVGGTPVDNQCHLASRQVYVELTPDPWPVSSVFWANKVAVLAPWSVAPHPIVELEADSTWRGIASDVLRELGVSDPNPEFVQLIRVDMEGDGVDEVLAVVERFRGRGEDIHAASAGDYSVAFLRKAVDGTVQTFVLGHYVVEAQPEGWIQDLVLSRVDGLVDIDQDGVDEIVLRTVYYEGSAAEVLDWQGSGVGFVSVLVQGCGS